MSEAPVDPTSTGAWSRLTALAQGFQPDLRTWFADDPGRVERFTFTAGDLGDFTVDADHTVLLGEPFRFNADNIGDFDF